MQLVYFKAHGKQVLCDIQIQITFFLPSKNFKLVCKRIFNMQAYCHLIKYNVPIFLDNI